MDRNPAVNFPTASPLSPVLPLLDRGEKLIWSGQPLQGIRLQAADLFMIPFSLMWGGFAIFWEAGVLGFINLGGKSTQHPAPAFFALWGIPFVLIGLYMIFGRFFGDAASRRKTWYALTDRRLIILQGLFTRQVNSYDFATLSNLNLVERSNQTGDILFGNPGPMYSTTVSGWPGSGKYRTPGFYQLPGAKAVFIQIQSTRATRSGS